jgi:hypothetical protein
MAKTNTPAEAPVAEAKTETAIEQALAELKVEHAFHVEDNTEADEASDEAPVATSELVLDNGLTVVTYA